MSKTVTIKLTKINPQAKFFNIINEFGDEIANDVPKSLLIRGISYEVSEDTEMLIIESIGECKLKKVFPLIEFDPIQYAKATYKQSLTGCVWKHLKNPIIYNSFYNAIKPYIIEYPFSYKFQDEILQNVIDYTKVYKYSQDGINSFNNVNKIEVDDIWFNKAVLYNGQQSSGVLELVPKPLNNLNVYSSYPIFNTYSKTILYTKSDNFYQYNTFWSIVKNKNQPLFIKTCENDSIDKEVNQKNMDYNLKSFKKEPLRAKELKIRHIFDNRSDTHLVSQFIVSPSQISYK